MRNQTGFIQNFIIPGIILIGVVIAGIAMLASNSGNSDLSNEKAAMEANALLGQATALRAAIERADADGGIPDTPQEYSAVSGTTLSDLLVGGKYVTALPQVSAAAAPHGAQWAFYRGQVRAYYPDSSDVGTSGADDVLVVSGLDSKVAARINNKLHGMAVNVASNTSWADVAGNLAMAGLGIGTAQAADEPACYWTAAGCPADGGGAAPAGGYAPGGEWVAGTSVKGPSTIRKVTEGVVSSDNITYTYYAVLKTR